MNTGLIFRNIGRWLLLVGLQVVVLDNVYIGGWANPILYVLFILMLPTGMNKNWMVTLAFLTGLTVDVFNNMLGFHAVACTLVAFMRTVFADRILTKDEPITISTPSIHSVRTQQYIGYMALLMGMYNLVYFSLVAFDLGDWWRVMISTVLSTVIDLVLALIYQAILLGNSEKNKTQNTVS